jgi:hypothetical protein
MYAHSAGHIQLNLINAIAFSSAQLRAFSHIAKFDRTLKVPESTTYFQAFGCFPQTFAANALSRLFRLGDFHFLRLSLQWLFRCKTSFVAEPLSH